MDNTYCKKVLAEWERFFYAGCPLFFSEALLNTIGGTMNKSEAIKRLDAIEKEQAELRKIIEKGDKIVYDSDRVYIGMYLGRPFLMAGCEQDGFVFYTLTGTNNSNSYAKAEHSGQLCLDYHISVGFNIHVFDNTKEALQFFIDHL